MKSAIFAIAISATGLAGSAAFAAPFVLHESRSLRVDWRQAPLITADDLTGTRHWATAAGLKITRMPSGKALNLYCLTSNVLDYRREAVQTPYGLEITARMRLYAYKEKEFGRPVVAYSFRVPASVFDGWTFRAVYDRPYRQKVKTGKLTAAMPDGGIAGSLAYLELRGPGGRGLTFDFAPKGRGLVYNVRSWAMVGNRWSLAKQGAEFVFSFGLRARWHGGMMTSKVVILDGARPYEELHPKPDEWHYTFVPQTTLAAVFAPRGPKGFLRLGLDRFARKRGIGWLDPTGLKQGPGLLGGMITGPSGRLRIETLPGYYLMTIRFGAARALGPFRLEANGVLLDPALRSDPGRVASKTFPIRLPDGKVALHFFGPRGFGLSAVVMQRLASNYEAGFIFDRPMWWVSDVPTPDKTVDPGRFIGPRRKLSSSPDWRWNMAMVSFGTDNIGTCNELNTYPLIERRMKEILALGFNTIICNGLHFRLSYWDRRTMILRNMRMICEVAHKYGVRVIEHNDVPILFAEGNGFKMLVKHVDWLQRDIETGKVAAMFCPANPDFLRWYDRWFRKYARDTGIDGAMLDEVTFFQRSFCGCKHCRKAFHDSTGLTLPWTNRDHVFHNTRNPLWVRWEKWRVRATTDFFAPIRRIFDDVNPAATLMTYTTHYGFTSDYASRNFGTDIVSRAKYCDFLGTEIMSRNVFASCRGVFALRKIKDALMLHFGRPVYGLIYHLNDPNIAYFGWALLHMNRQVAWMASIEGVDMRWYIHWKDAMDIKNARALSDVAVVFSRTCCNYNRRSSHVSDAVGISEMLTDRHIQHDFILDLDLTPKALRRYRLLILPSVECLSRTQLRAIRDYVRSGGRLLATGWTSLCDENGSPRPDFGLAAVLGVHAAAGALHAPLEVEIPGRPPVRLRYGAPRAVPAEGARVLARFLDSAGRPGAPAVVQNRFGKGTATWAAPLLGSLNYEREFTARQLYTYTLDREERSLVWTVLDRACPDAHPFTAVQVPEKVLTAVYRIPRGYAVHFLNAAGNHLKKGEKVPASEPKDPFPPLSRDLVFDLAVPALVRGRAVAPDRNGAVPVRIEKHGTAFRVTVPRTALHSFAIVYLEE